MQIQHLFHILLGSLLLSASACDIDAPVSGAMTEGDDSEAESEEESGSEIDYEAFGNCRGQEKTQSDPYIDCIEEMLPIAGSNFNHDELPEVILGAPGGTVDVASLGCGGQITVFFDSPGIVNGPGADLVVFENPFSINFPEPARVELSLDGENWKVFDCNPETLVGCAGVALVGDVTEEESAEDFSALDLGGDRFDLEELGMEKAQFVRIVDVSQIYWAQQGLSWCDPGQGGAGGFDLDAMMAVAHGSLP